MTKTAFLFTNMPRHRITDKQLVRHMFDNPRDTPLRKFTNNNGQFWKSSWLGGCDSFMRSFLRSSEPSLIKFLQGHEPCWSDRNSRVLLIVEADQLREIIVRDVALRFEGTQKGQHALNFVKAFEAGDAATRRKLHETRFRTPGAEDFVWLYGIADNSNEHPVENAPLVASHLYMHLDGQSLGDTLKQKVLPIIEEVIEWEHSYTKSNFPEIYATPLERLNLAVHKAVKTLTNKLERAVKAIN